MMVVAMDCGVGDVDNDDDDGDDDYDNDDDFRFVSAAIVAERIIAELVVMRLKDVSRFCKQIYCQPGRLQRPLSTT